MTHFTPWDCNWPYGPPYDAEYPSEGPEPPGRRPQRRLHRRQHHRVREHGASRGDPPGRDGLVPGRRTGADRVVGRTAEYSTLIDLVPLPPEHVPASLGSIIVEVIGGGQHRVWEWFRNQYGGPTWPAILLYTWDGKDGYGREANGPQKFRIRVGYQYGAIYQAVFGGGPGQGGASFGQASGQSAVGDQTRNTITLWTEWEVTLGTVRHLAAGLGGWSLSIITPSTRSSGCCSGAMASGCLPSPPHRCSPGWWAARAPDAATGRSTEAPP